MPPLRPAGTHGQRRQRGGPSRSPVEPRRDCLPSLALQIVERCDVVDPLKGPVITGLATALGAGSLAVAVWAGLRPARSMASAALSLYGVGLGVLQSVFTRRTYTVWAPAASIRA